MMERGFVNKGYVYILTNPSLREVSCGEREVNVPLVKISMAKVMLQYARNTVISKTKRAEAGASASLPPSTRPCRRRVRNGALSFARRLRVYQIG